jgi:hypothetical protein
MFSSSPRTGTSTAKKPKQTPKKGISPDVNNLIKSMMKSSKLSNTQQNYLDSFITSDNELPLSRPMLYKPSPRKQALPIKLQQSRPNRRQLETIVAKGDFVQEPYRPQPVKTNRAKEIEKLSDSMSRGDGFMYHSSMHSSIPEENVGHSHEVTIDEATMCMLRC